MFCCNMFRLMYKQPLSDWQVNKEKLPYMESLISFYTAYICRWDINLCHKKKLQHYIKCIRYNNRLKTSVQIDIIKNIYYYFQMRVCGPRKLSRYSDCARGWTVRGSNSGWGGRDFIYPSRPALEITQSHVEWVSLSLRQSGRDVALTTNPYITPRSKKE